MSALEQHIQARTDARRYRACRHAQQCRRAHVAPASTPAYFPDKDLSAVDGGFTFALQWMLMKQSAGHSSASRTPPRPDWWHCLCRDCEVARSAAPQTAVRPAEDQPDTRRQRRSASCSSRLAAAFAPVFTGRIVSLIDKNLDRQHHRVSFHAWQRRQNVRHHWHTPKLSVRKE